MSIITLNKLIPEKVSDFETKIRRLKKKPLEDNENYDEVKEKVVEAVEKSINDVDKVGVLFSGGIDSTILAKIASDYVDVTCYTAGLADSQDVVFAQKVAAEMSLALKQKIIGENEVEEYAKRVIECVRDTNVMKVGVGIPFYASFEIIKEDVVLGGLGAEELFAGYAKFQKAVPDYELVEKMLWEGLELLPRKDLQRDLSIAAEFKKELRAPYLDLELIRTVMLVHPKYKVDENKRKILLRKIGKDLGLPESVYTRPKKATQYGSGVDRVLRKNAKKKGIDVQTYLNALTKSINL